MSTIRRHDTNTAASLRPGSLVVSLGNGYPLATHTPSRSRELSVPPTISVEKGDSMRVDEAHADNSCVTGVRVKVRVRGGLTPWLDASWFGVYEGSEKHESKGS